MRGYASLSPVFPTAEGFEGAYAAVESGEDVVKLARDLDAHVDADADPHRALQYLLLRLPPALRCCATTRAMATVRKEVKHLYSAPFCLSRCARHLSPSR